MNLHIFAAMLLFYGTVKGAKQALRTGGSEIMTVPENNSEEKPARVMALVIVKDVEESEETNPMKSEVMLPLVESPEIMLPWLESIKPESYDEDTSGDSNSEEYSDSDTSDSDSDTDKESYYYHEDDYLKNTIMKKIADLNLEINNSKSLRNRWKSCQKKASKYCRQACQAAYKNACSEYKCKKKLKKVLKKQCKQNCKDYFIDS